MNKFYIGIKKIPDIYQQIEYLQGDKIAYIETPYCPNTNTRIVAEVANFLNGNETLTAFGSRVAHSNNAFSFDKLDYGRYRTTYGTSNGYFDETINYNDKFIIDQNKNITTITHNSLDTTITNTSNTFTSTIPLDIFGLNDNGEHKFQSDIIIYSFKIYDNNTLVYDFIPCFRKNDNKPGLYDFIHNIFYTNASNIAESNFICGPIIKDSGIARQVSKIYVGVNGVARSVYKGYTGINNNATLIFPPRDYLFSHKTGDNTVLTGGWTSGTFYHQTNSGTNYSMTRMSIGTFTGGVYGSGYMIHGSFSSTDGTSEKALYTMTTKAINLQPYKKLCCILERYTSRDTNPMDAWFGVFNASSTSSTLTCQSNQLEQKFLASATHINNPNSGYQSVTLEIDVSSLTGSYIILYDNFHSNMNAAINIHILDIWLE